MRNVILRAVAGPTSWCVKESSPDGRSIRSWPASAGAPQCWGPRWLKTAPSEMQAGASAGGPVWSCRMTNSPDFESTLSFITPSP